MKVGNHTNIGKSYGPHNTANVDSTFPKPFKGEVISSYWKILAKGQ